MQSVMHSPFEGIGLFFRTGHRSPGVQHMFPLSQGAARESSKSVGFSPVFLGKLLYPKYPDLSKGGIIFEDQSTPGSRHPWVQG